jgi:hypothetical protein
MPAENRTAIEQKLSECRTILAQQKPSAPPPSEPVVQPSPAEPRPQEPAPVVDDRENPLPDAPSPPVASGSPSSSWHRDPITLGLLGGGVVAGGVGLVFLMSSRSLHGDAETAAGIDESRDLVDKRDQRLTIARISGGVGAALVVGGVVSMMLRGDRSEKPAVTGWVTGDGGGLAVAGGF